MGIPSAVIGAAAASAGKHTVPVRVSVCLSAGVQRNVWPENESCHTGAAIATLFVSIVSETGHVCHKE